MSRRGAIKAPRFIALMSLRFRLIGLIKPESCTARRCSPIPIPACWLACGSVVTMGPARRCRQRPTTAMTSPCFQNCKSPLAPVPATAFCLTSVIRLTRLALTQWSIQASRIGTRRRFPMMAARYCLPMNGVVARGPAAACLIRSTGALTPFMTSLMANCSSAAITRCRRHKPRRKTVWRTMAH